MCRQFQAQCTVHTVPSQCTEEIVGECDKIKDLRCKQVEEKEYENVDKEECGNEGTVFATEQCYTQYEEEY